MKRLTRYCYYRRLGYPDSVLVQRDEVEAPTESAGYLIDPPLAPEGFAFLNWYIEPVAIDA